MFLSLLHVDVRHGRPGRSWLRNVYHVHQRLWMAFPDSSRKKDDPFFLGTWDTPVVPDPKPTRHECGFLFRIEHDGPTRVLVQSAQRPDWDYGFQNALGLLADAPRVRQFEPELHRDQAYRFRLLANVVRRNSVVHPSGGTRRTRSLPRKKRTATVIRPDPIPVPLPRDPAEREQALRTRWDPWRKWIRDVGASRGFRVVEDRESPLFMEAVRLTVRVPGKGRDGSTQARPTVRNYNAGLFEGMLVCTEEDRFADALAGGIGPAKAFGCGLLSVAPL